jgi:serine/threonine-protein kinase
MLARPAAIKLVRLDGLASDLTSHETSLARFEREAQVTAQLQSPHTVELYDFGRSDSGELYYVMELLDGIDLETLVEAFGPLEAPRVAHVLLQVCHSLAEAHHQGLIHRDIKPANIFVCQRALDYDFVKVLDFGLVKRSRRLESRQEPSMTGVGTIPGTPAYVAPEIALGRPDVDGRADLYALGCVAYWLLTGRRVFDDETPVGQVVAHVQKTPEPPSARTEVTVPPELDELVMACLAKDPEDRPQSAEALASRLRDTGLAAGWSNDRARQWWRRHRPDKLSA